MPTSGPNQSDHEKWMREAIRLAVEKMRAGEGGPFGAVIVRNNKIIGQGWNRVTSTNDPTAHAEVCAIRNACQNENSFSLSGSAIYCSCQPCPMCHGAILWARLDRIYYAASSQVAADAGFDDSQFRQQMQAPIDQQIVPLIQTLGDHGTEPFEAWKKFTRRIEY